MKGLIEESKTLFGEYGRLYSLDICSPCCVSREDEQLLLGHDRYQVPLPAIYAYNDTAKSGYTLETMGELKYFAPRILELVAQNAEVHHSRELYLQRFHLAPREGWSPSELDFFERYALALFAEQLGSAKSPIRTLVMLHDLPVDVSALFPPMFKQHPKQLVLFFADLYLYKVNWRKHKLINAFARKELSNVVIEFLLKEDTLRRVSETLEHLVWVQAIELSAREEEQFEILYTVLGGLRNN
ncbi:hypothetical protein [Maribacter sp. 2307ULW6-5]|uniref:hypothetical protein n=1 Tax=Maribacter sp. 2307ULW6-5 TaxID=3386275 RepID=UPI0039BC98EE